MARGRLCGGRGTLCCVRLTARMTYNVSPSAPPMPDRAKLAAAFLEETCEGAQGLSDNDAAALRSLRGTVAGQRTSIQPRKHE